MRSSAFVGGLGLLIILGASAMAIRGSGQDWEYNLTVSKNSSGPYAIAGHPPNKHYRLDDGSETRLFFTNRTGDPIQVQVGDFELVGSPMDCPVDSTNCSELIPNIPNTETRLVTLKVNPKLEDDAFGESYDFLFKVAPLGGNLQVVDPDLEIDRNFYFFYETLAGMLGLLMVAGAWWTRRRSG